ncbi:MAG: glycosyltransferase family 39 protein [Planctomycetota bacterium]
MPDSGIKKTLLQRLRHGLSNPWTVVLFTLVLTGTLLRFKGLTFQSLWFDELFSVGKSHPDLSLPALMEQFRSSEDPHPPLYFALLHFWFHLFGYTEWSARAFSAAAGSFGLIALYMLVRELADRKCALIAVALLMLNRFHLQFSQEVRAYVLMFAWTCLSYTWFARSLKSMKARDLLAYSIISTAMIYTHYFGLFVLVSQAAYFLMHLLFRIRKGDAGKLAMRFFLSGMVIGLLYLPWVPVILANMDRKEFWAGKPDSSFFLRLFERFFGEEPFLVWIAAAMILIAVIYAAVASFRCKNREACMEGCASMPMVLLWIFLCLVIPYFRSITDVPMLVFRYEIIILPAVLFLVSMGIHVFKNRIVILLIVAGIVAVSYLNVFHHNVYFSEIRKEQFREASCFVIETKREKYADQPMVVMSDVSGFYNVYFELLGSDIRAIQLRDRTWLASLLKERQGLKMGIWILSGHYKRSLYVAELFKVSGFEQVEAKELMNATAFLYMK